MVVGELSSSFVLGLLTPLTAACVLPLYPGYISYLSKQFSGEESQKTYALFGVVVVGGVMSFMLGLGLIFSALLQLSLTSVIETVSPLAFGLLGMMSIALIIDLDIGSQSSGFEGPEFDNPLASAYGFGFFFGAIIIPCNPAFISVFFARAFLFDTPISSLMNFTAFGLGIGFPLLFFSLASSRWSDRIISVLKRYETEINRVSGLVMLAVSVYYLVFVFQILG
ncbi:MAG: cytochrome C biogenesis protein [Nanohaloarchaea archaeon SW_7_43_1]|nr:MAG: cytochrome C biogenesis protein [Nanohaloarchaea archaeon SW_7_43_1]